MNDMNMKFLMMGLLMPFAASAQEIEAVDSIDVETGVIYYAGSTQVNDMIIPILGGKKMTQRE